MEKDTRLEEKKKKHRKSYVARGKALHYIDYSEQVKINRGKSNASKGSKKTKEKPYTHTHTYAQSR